MAGVEVNIGWRKVGGEEASSGCSILPKMCLSRSLPGEGSGEVEMGGGATSACLVRYGGFVWRWLKVRGNVMGVVVGGG